jgi:lipopolysaccharide transport system ATP-binding protein
MYVRLAFAVAAHLDSDILIADEVLAVGDASFQKKALGKMNDLSTGQGRTVLFVSHNIEAVKTLCNKGILLERGRIVADTNLTECIELYMHKNIYLSKWEGDIGDENLRLKKAELNPGLPVEHILRVTKGEKITLSIQYDIRIPNQNYGFNIEIFNDKGTLLCESSISEFIDEEEFKKLKATGLHTIQLEIDTSLFGRGLYSVKFDLAICNYKRIIHDDPTLSFEIDDKGQSVLGVPRRRDVIVPDWKWEIIDL